MVVCLLLSPKHRKTAEKLERWDWRISEETGNKKLAYSSQKAQGKDEICIGSLGLHSGMWCLGKGGEGGEEEEKRKEKEEKEKEETWFE